MFVYLAGPLSANADGTQEQHVAKAVQLYLDLTREGVATYCPHLSALAPGAPDVPYEQWMKTDFDILEHATVVLMLDGWQNSPGAVREHGMALALGKRIIYNAEELTS